MSSRSSIVLSLLLLQLLPGGSIEQAHAHAYPAAVSPTDGATVSAAPREVRMQFTEDVELEFSQIVAKSPTGEIVSQGPVRRISSDSLAVDLKPLRPGAYTIEWRVLSVDTHITEGVLRFTVTAGDK